MIVHDNRDVINFCTYENVGWYGGFDIIAIPIKDIQAIIEKQPVGKGHTWLGVAVNKESKVLLDVPVKFTDFDLDNGILWNTPTTLEWVFKEWDKRGLPRPLHVQRKGE